MYHLSQVTWVNFCPLEYFPLSHSLSDLSWDLDTCSLSSSVSVLKVLPQWDSSTKGMTINHVCSQALSHRRPNITHWLHGHCCHSLSQHSLCACPVSFQPIQVQNLFSRIRSAQGYTEVQSEKVNLGANTPIVPSLFSYFRIVEKKKKEAKVSNTHAALPFSNKAIWTSRSAPLNWSPELDCLNFAYSYPNSLKCYSLASTSLNSKVFIEFGCDGTHL